MRYSTTDLGLASALLAKGYHSSLNRDKLGTLHHKVVFEFEISDELKIDIKDFWDKKLQVDALSMFESIKALKARIYDKG